METALTSAEPHTVVVRVGADALLADVQAGRHTFVLDEPENVGGQDRGPTPYDMLLSALGACTAITLRLYATQKKWPLTGIEVRLRHRRVHVVDCEACESGDARMDEVHKELRLLGELSEEQRQRLEQISHKCPVQKTLMAGVRISTTLLPAEASFPA
ncbi:OsmC family protein [Hymenobacter sp. 15J16-1T3B]|uniref:OsmC family protein n=1 Tax=Hymenobacter sp. 15J16-1T3B TaxID=2886941 RepID=UPI001D0FC166|nr:OsmC family protein [Hymenobacter sp. 15J16-1T3B]MCC3159094.1 OsmC family protein [Hymenobacter sp. 15J16-1T3B]